MEETNGRPQRTICSIKWLRVVPVLAPEPSPTHQLTSHHVHSAPECWKRSQADYQGNLLIFCERKETWMADLQSCRTETIDCGAALQLWKVQRTTSEKSNNPKNHLLIKRLMKHWNVLHVKRLRDEHRLQTSDYDVAFLESRIKSASASAAGGLAGCSEFA